MALDQEQTLRECPHCGSANAVSLGTRECPCCGQGYGAQGLADHLPVPDEDARLAPATLGIASVVALGVVAAFALTPWALLGALAFVVLFVALLAVPRRRQL